MMKTALKKTVDRLGVIYHRYAGYPVLLDVFRREGAYKKQILFEYLAGPFMADPDNKALFRAHQNWGQNLQIARILDEMGYIIDVVDWSDFRFVPARRYDAFIGTGQNGIRIAGLLPSEVPKLGITVGMEASAGNRNLEKRYQALEHRRGFRLERRDFASDFSRSLSAYSMVACFGNEYIAEGYRPFNPRVMPFNNTGYDEALDSVRDFNNARRAFLYLASARSVRRGLDLLLEIFSMHPDYELHICSPLKTEKDFCRCYERELFKTRNIHLHGWVEVTSSLFMDLLGACGAVIMPSCGEGQPGAVTLCMNAGLIPIVSRECGIDTEDFGITLEDCSLAAIENTVVDFANRPPAWHEEHSRRTREVALRKFSPEAFDRRWRAILKEFLGAA